jgi:nucleotide-binding universal stress UspA family protein
LVATDGSAGADRAVKLAAELAKALDGKLSIVTAGGTLSGDETRKLVRAEGNIGEAIEAISGQILIEAKERARRIGVSDIQVQTSWGDAAEANIEITRREGVNMIVLGRRGRGRLTGCCSEACLRSLWVSSLVPSSSFYDHLTRMPC